MLYYSKKRARLLSVFVALVMVLTVWAAVPASDRAYAADHITINWGHHYSDENAGYICFDYDGSGSQTARTSVTLPDAWEYDPAISTPNDLMGSDTKLPDGLELTSFAFDSPSNPKTADLEFTYTPGNILFEGEQFNSKKPRQIGVLDLHFSKDAISGYTGSDFKVPIVAEVVRSWEIPYGAREYRELFTTQHSGRVNYFQGAKYDWTEDLDPSTYWMHPDFNALSGGTYGTLTLVDHFKTQQQPTGYSCGLSSTVMLLDYWGEHGFAGREANKVRDNNTGTFDTLTSPVLLNEQDLSKLRNAKGPGRSRDWGGATSQTELENIFKNLSSVYGQNAWNYVSGFDITPTPTKAPAYEQSPMVNVLGLKSGDTGYNAALTMPLAKAVPWYIEHGVPVILGWQGWGGHYEVIIGYDTMGTDDTADDVVILADPYDSVDQKMDGFLIKPWQKIIDDWNVGGWGDTLGRFVFMAAWPKSYNIQAATLSSRGALPVTNNNSASTAATVIKGTDSAAYAGKVGSQLTALGGAKQVYSASDPTTLNHMGTPYWKTDMDQVTQPGSTVYKLASLTKYSDFETIQASARGLDGPASMLMSMNYFAPTGDITDIDLAKLKGTGKELTRSTLSDMINILDDLNAKSMKNDGKPAWNYYSTFDMNDGKAFFGEEVDEVSIIPTAMQKDVPLMVMAHEGGDQWNTVIGMEDIRGDDEDDATQEDVLVFANPVDVSDHNRNGLSLFQYEWLIYDWGNSFGTTDTAPAQTFLAIWPNTDERIKTTDPITTYNVTLNANGGKFSDKKSTQVMKVAAGAKIGSLATPVRKGYAFMGWFTKGKGGTKITSGYIVKKDATIYAHWARKGTLVKKAALYKKATAKSKVIKKYKKGKSLIIIGSKGKFYKVKIGKKIGYVYKKSIKLARK